MYELGGPENLPHPDDDDLRRAPVSPAGSYSDDCFEDGTMHLENDESIGGDEAEDADIIVGDVDAWLQPTDDEYCEPDPRLVQLYGELSERRSLTAIFEEDLLDGALDHMALLPPNDTIFVRSFPGISHTEPARTAAESEQLIDDTRTHLAALSSIDSSSGIRIPNTYYQVREHLDGTATIDNITERVEGRPLINADTERFEDDGQRQAALTVARTLIGYFSWAYREKPTYLTDLTNPAQYFIASDGTPVYIDTDPVMRSTAIIPNEHGEGGDELDWSLKQLKSYLFDRLPPSQELTALRQEADALQSKIKAAREAHYEHHKASQQTGDSQAA